MHGCFFESSVVARLEDRSINNRTPPSAWNEPGQRAGSEADAIHSLRHLAKSASPKTGTQTGPTMQL